MSPSRACCWIALCAAAQSGVAEATELWWQGTETVETGVEALAPSGGQAVAFADGRWVVVYVKESECGCGNATTSAGGRRLR